ncbi:peptide chain release factor 2 [Sulfurimonas sp.]|uniref:peptide chain release factor 2 n=1 Tax=Sulfurimonas sp. TaxID=2022749 RepID=UPI002B48A9AE|nr:peptide chain release factor 2 [Sulfurimonas sp.]
MDNYEYTELLKSLNLKMNNITGVVEPKKIQTRLDEIKSLESEQDFWLDATNAAKIQKEKTQYQRKLDKYFLAYDAVVDASQLYDMAKEENDEESIEACYDDSIALEQLIRNMEIEVLLSGESDSNNAIISIHPGAGGTESQDWAAMLLRMYKMFASRRGFSIEILDYQTGEEAGIKDVSFIVKGENAYGYLKVETGIHRLVRISPFDSNAKRHTSFSSVVVSPEIDDDINIVIEDKDLRVDTYRASGAGGQHVNKTESAIRLTHIQTGVVVQCQNDRSQHKNKATAMKMLKSRLYELELEAQKAAQDGVAKSEIGWGHQIRSYVMQPYQQVKDTRSNEAFSNISAILDGDMDKLIEGVLISINRG